MFEHHHPLEEESLRELVEAAWKIDRSLDRLIHVIERHFNAPRLSRIQISFQGEPGMATIGPVTLTAGQSVTASIAGFDQNGNPWTGTIPPVTYTIDAPTVATSTPNADGLTDGITAVAAGVANLTATLTTAEGLALTDTEAITVTGGTTGTPVLSSIKLQFA